MAQLIPSAALGGLLVVIGIQLVKRAHIRTARRTGDITVYVVTVVAVVFLNLLEGVLIGLALAVVFTVWRVVRVRIVAEPDGDGDWRVVVEGSCTFLSLPRLTRVLASVPADAHVALELSVDFIDHPAHEAIADWQRQHRASGGTVDIHEFGGVDMHSAVEGPPMRRLPEFDNRSGVIPWGSWQLRSRSVMAGLAAYHRRTAPVLRPHMQDLAHAQRPESLFITCTDSRIVPNVITSSGPGDLFTVRNVGNMVPAGQQDPSMEAGIAFAVEKLGVRSIVVCGHSSCGAMSGLLRGAVERTPGDAYLNAWLSHGQPALNAYNDGHHPVALSAAAGGFGAVDQLSMVNVAVQVQTLMRHPLVAEPATRGLEVIGLFYDVASAAVWRVEPTFVERMDSADAPIPVAATAR